MLVRSGAFGGVPGAHDPALAAARVQQFLEFARDAATLPLAHVNIINEMLYIWVSPLMKLGYQRPLQGKSFIACAFVILYRSSGLDPSGPRVRGKAAGNDDTNMPLLRFPFPCLCMTCRPILY